MYEDWYLASMVLQEMMEELPVSMRKRERERKGGGGGEKTDGQTDRLYVRGLVSGQIGASRYDGGPAGQYE